MSADHAGPGGTRTPGSAAALEIGTATPKGAGRGRTARHTGVVLLGLVVPALILLAWHFSTASGFFRPSQLPSPASVLAAAVDLIERGQLATHILISTQRVVLGFVIGSKKTAPKRGPSIFRHPRVQRGYMPS